MEEVRTFKKDAHTLIGEEGGEIEEVETGAKLERKNSGNGESPSDGYGRFTQTEALGLAKAWVAQSKKMLK